jgi:hypothetical protein
VTSANALGGNGLPDVEDDGDMEIENLMLY